MENCIVLFSFMNYVKRLNVFLCVFLEGLQLLKRRSGSVFKSNLFDRNSAHSVFLKHPEIFFLH